MPAYKAPLRDIRFLMNEMLDYPAHYQTLTSGQNADAETVDMILEGAADYCENVLSPLNQSGDEEGCTFNNGEVTTPKGFKEAYDQFVMGGWQGLSYPEEFGGQGLPSTRLPGLGPRSARRAVLHLIKKKEGLMIPLSAALDRAVEAVRECQVCGNIDTRSPCGICANAACWTDARCLPAISLRIRYPATMSV